MDTHTHTHTHTHLEFITHDLCKRSIDDERNDDKYHLIHRVQGLGFRV